MESRRSGPQLSSRHDDDDDDDDAWGVMSRHQESLVDSVCVRDIYHRWLLLSFSSSIINPEMNVRRCLMHL